MTEQERWALGSTPSPGPGAQAWLLCARPGWMNSKEGSDVS